MMIFVCCFLVLSSFPELPELSLFLLLLLLLYMLYPTSYKCEIFCIHMGSTEIAGGLRRRFCIQSWSLWGPQLPKGVLSPPYAPVPCGQPLVFNVCVWALAFELKFGNLFYFSFSIPCSSDSLLKGYTVASLKLKLLQN